MSAARRGAVDSHRLRALCVVSALVAGCAHPPRPPAPPATPGFHVLYAAPADGVAFATRGRLRPQYRAAGVAGEPLPYEHAVQSSLILCAALGPLFGPCAGVLIGGAAVAGVTEHVVTTLAEPGSATADEARLREVFAPGADPASAIGRRIVDDALAHLESTDAAAAIAAAPAPAGCAPDGHGRRPREVNAVDVVQLELELEAGFQYRLVVVARVRSEPCSDGHAAPERRLAYRGRPQTIARDPAAARAQFETGLAEAIAALAADVATQVRAR